MRVPEELELDSGVKVVVHPVPPLLYSALVRKYERRRPRPKAPVVEVAYKGEDKPRLEENQNDPDYRARLDGWHAGLTRELMGYFYEEKVAVEVPADWVGEDLRRAGVKVPAPRGRLAQLLGLRKGAERERQRLYLSYVALQTPDDIERLTEAVLSAAGIPTERMVSDAEDSFPGRSGRAPAEKVGDAAKRRVRLVGFRGGGSGADVSLQPDEMGEPERAGEGAGAGYLQDEDEAG